MDHMKFETPDMTAQNIDKIAALFPNCITEMRDENGKIKRGVNFEMLKQMLSPDVVDGDERYEFTWVGKKASIVEANKPIRKTLRPCPEESKNWDTTENLYIEGDNLEVLKLLQEAYLGKVKMIYIDPPYNTGHDFIYNDRFEMDKQEYDQQTGLFDEEGNKQFAENTESNPRFHSDWCSMMYPRLMLARNLLADDGFIAISIGEEEEYNLRELCNEVFGDANFRNIIEVRRYDKNLNLQFVANGLATMNVGLEYILVYSKNPSSKMTAVYKSSSDDRSQSGYWKGFWNSADRPTMRYDVLGVTPVDGQWKWKKEIADEAVANYIEYEEHYSDKISLEEYWVLTGKRKRFIRRKPDGSGKNLGVEHWVSPAEGILRNSNWSDMLVSKPIGMDIKFDSPKNPDVIRELIKLFGVSNGDTVLDFFSGSATTAHAVMEQNFQDVFDGKKGKRKFIMVQWPEKCDEKSEAHKAGYKNICEIGKERIRRAGEAELMSIKAIAGSGMRWQQERLDEFGNKIMTPNDVDIGFRVLKVADTNMEDVYYSADEYDQSMLQHMESNIKPDRTDLDLLFGCLLDWGLPLSLPYTSEQIDGCTVHTYDPYSGDRPALIACFDPNVPETVVKEIAKRKPLRAVFRDSSFADSPAKINVFEIFKLLSADTRVKVI